MPAMKRPARKATCRRARPATRDPTKNAKQLATCKEQGKRTAVGPKHERVRSGKSGEMGFAAGYHVDLSQDDTLTRAAYVNRHVDVVQPMQGMYPFGAAQLLLLLLLHGQHGIIHTLQ